jgi:single-stranded-DNA-specific exonuclease
MDSRWIIKRTNSEYVHYLSRTASISPVLARILINRGIKTADDVHGFLHPNLSSLSDPFELPDMNVAVERIISALKRNERIFIHGDFDADGLSATAILYQMLTSLGADCHYFIPNRFIHGYGFKSEGVKKAKELGAELIITVDCGITSFDTVRLCQKEGIDVIVTDHHEPQRKTNSKFQIPNSNIEETQDIVLPDAIAVVNPKISNTHPRVKNLSGSGIALKFVQALSMTYGSQLVFHDFLDLAAIGTIADVVPITGENRVIVNNGMSPISNKIRQTFLFIDPEDKCCRKD